MKLLVVEDNQADVFLVQDAIRHEGLKAEVQVASDGELAIHLISSSANAETSTAFDCFLIDFNLPKKSGAEVLRHVRQSPVFGKCPVIMMTSSDAQMEHRKILDLGATEVFVKPFQLSEFRQLVRLVERSFRDGHR
jgi:DNA-binding response OmpR family regulator